MVVVGILFVIAAWLAGPGRRALASRRCARPGAPQTASWAYVVLAVVVLLLLVTRPTTRLRRAPRRSSILAALGATWIELTRSQTLRRVPGRGGPAFLDDARTKVESWRDSPARKRRAGRSSRSPADVTARLATLADLHVAAS